MYTSGAMRTDDNDDVSIINLLFQNPALLNIMFFTYLNSGFCFKSYQIV